MKELNDIVLKKTKEMVTDGTIEKMVTENLEKAVRECVANTFKSYGDFGKVLQEKIDTAMQCAGRDIDIPEYNLFIKEIVTKKFSEVLHADVAEHLNSLIGDIIKPFKKEAKISELLQQVEREWASEARSEGHEYIEIECMDSAGSEHTDSLMVTFKAPNCLSRDIEATFYCHDKSIPYNEKRWHIGYIKEANVVRTGKILNRSTTYSSSVGDILFKYYAMGSKFEMDVEIESLYVADY